MQQRFWVRGRGEGQFIDFEERSQGPSIRTGEKESSINISTRPGSPFFHLLVDGRSYPCAFQEEEHTVVLNVRGRRYRFEVLSERRKRIRDLGISDEEEISDRNIVAPIPGLIVEIEVSAGDMVAAGDGIVIIEAMKMENELKAAGPGIVKEIKVSKGEPVDQGQLLVVIA